MRYRQSLWDDSEPLYAPGKIKVRNSYKWTPTKKAIAAGYSSQTYPLPGRVGDDQDIERARMCREYTREMVRWYEGETAGKEEDTWGWLITRYMTDEYSPFHSVGVSTRQSYRKALANIEEGIGRVKISETDYPRMMRWIKAMQDNRRSKDYIHRWFRHWGLALSHGVRLGLADCRRIKEIRSEMRIDQPAHRTKYLTRDQISLIVSKLDEDGDDLTALATLLRFEFMLRGVDVYGDWEPAEGRQGGIQDGGQMWVKGLTWEMVSDDVTTLTKLINKTANKQPEPYVFDLTNVPDIRERLLRIPAAQRIGPIIKFENGHPPKNGYFSRHFKKALRAVKLPDDLRIADARSGGVTEAKALVEPMELRDAAQHTQLSTTNRYARGRSETANKVVALRNKKP